MCAYSEYNACQKITEKLIIQHWYTTVQCLLKAIKENCNEETTRLWY